MQMLAEKQGRDNTALESHSTSGLQKRTRWFTWETKIGLEWKVNTSPSHFREMKEMILSLASDLSDNGESCTYKQYPREVLGLKEFNRIVRLVRFMFVSVEIVKGVSSGLQFGCIWCKFYKFWNEDGRFVVVCWMNDFLLFECSVRLQKFWLRIGIEQIRERSLRDDKKSRGKHGLTGVRVANWDIERKVMMAGGDSRLFYGGVRKDENCNTERG